MITTETPLKKFIKPLLAPLKGSFLYSYLHAISMARDIKSIKFTEPEIFLIPYFVEPGSVAIDIGSNYGLYCYHLSKHVGPPGLVYGFEPIPYTFFTLKKVCRFLGLDNLHLTNSAIGNTKGLMQFDVPTQQGGHLMGGQAHLHNTDSFRDSSPGQQIWDVTKVFDCQVDLLDNLIPDSDKSRVSFLKLDIEGSEFFALQGAIDILSKSCPTLLVEINPTYLSYFNVALADFLDFLFTRNYHMYAFQPSDKSLLSVERNSEIIEANYIFVHDSKLPIVQSINSQATAL